ncbi:toll-like receptor 6 [Eublepharis macularius]|uniref:Toll-like receptor 6 n=1 Tax=Eublepharis macularius TaxID=481883 RepID=A0AA97K0B9_EUBMA|nr:toll-like receptor 6 [Eublepharis macularius]
MTKTRSLRTKNFICVCICIITFYHSVVPSVENGYTADYSKRFLEAVPKNLPADTMGLDLSQNSICEVGTSDFNYLSKLRILKLAHNCIRDIDFSIFQNNKNLEYLDLSHNKLWTVSCYPIMNLRHLNLSYNNLSMPMCSEFSKMLKLEYLAIGTRRIQKSDFSVLAHLQLDTLFLDLENLSEYKAENLSMFNAKNLQIALPPNKEFHIVLNLELSSTVGLELSNVQDDHVNDLNTILRKLSKNVRLRNLTLSHMKTSLGNVVDLFQNVWKTTIEYFNVYYLTITQLRLIPPIPDYAENSLRALTIKHVIIKETEFNQTEVYKLFSEMKISALTVSNATAIHMLCPSKPSRFTYLNFSYNSITDTLFEECDNLALLETLILHVNQFKKFTKVSSMTSHMKSLKYLDMSQNLLQYEDHEKGCSWGENLVELNLSSNLLSDSVFHCLPVNIQKLDLQNNQISSIPKEMVELRALEELNLASNRLTDLPGCGQFSSLRLLNAAMNSIFTPSSEFYHTCQSIREVKAEHNPFMCSCELRVFINLRKQGMVELVGWPESYLCEYPEYLRGIQLKDFHISELVCNTTLLVAVVLVILVVFAVIISFLCVYLDVPWYLTMMWQWTQVKHRVWKNKPEDIHDNIIFHAFISYSERDSDWVKNVLIPNLEKEDGSIRLCQHERNFIAGKSIVENIIDCIEKSYRSIFVLSPNFVQSEWCHYELYFAHHKLFRENTNNLILLLLEPIPTHIIPVRYHKLKALMAKRTYLEWPKEKSKHGLFWANLRASIHIKLTSSKAVNELQIYSQLNY